MDEIVTRIQEYVEVIYPTIKVDLSIDDPYLEFLVNDVVDRALIYMNRDQLVRQYEEDVADYAITDKTDESERYYDFWRDYDKYPIPPRLERILAKTVVGVAKTVIDNNKADIGRVEKVKDQGQEVTFKNELTSYLSSGSDSDIFSGSLVMLDRYRLGKVIKDEYINNIF